MKKKVLITLIAAICCMGVIPNCPKTDTIEELT